MNQETLDRFIKNDVTPAYIFDTDVLKRRVQQIKNRLGGNVDICYAMKANPFLIHEINKVTDKFEVCSPGEFRICERNGIDIDKVVLSGVYKNPDDIRRTVETYGEKITYTVESYTQFELLRECSEKTRRKLPILIRLSYGGNQFGVDQATVERIISREAEYAYLDIKGLQMFSGTQKKNIQKVEQELQLLDACILELEEKYGFHAKEMEYGPGLYISYYNNQEDKSDEQLSELNRILKGLHFQGKIILEMGRFIAATCGIYVTSVVDIKEIDGRKICIVNGGINHVNYYGQTMALRTPHVSQKPERSGGIEKWNVYGALCTTGDLLLKEFPLTNIQLGDVLVFQDIGAYSVTESMYLFLSRDLPGIYLYSEDVGFELVRPGFPTDVLNCAQRRYSKQWSFQRKGQRYGDCKGGAC